MAVTYENVATSLGRTITSPTEQAQITQWIADARLVIRVRLGDLNELDQEILDFVVRESVAERVKNPNRYTSETVDEYTYRRDTADSWITDEWWNMLDPDTGSGAFSVRPSFEADDSAVLESWA